MITETEVTHCILCYLCFAFRNHGATLITMHIVQIFYGKENSLLYKQILQIANFLYHNYTYLGYKINKKIVKNLAIYGGKFVIICA